MDTALKLKPDKRAKEDMTESYRYRSIDGDPHACSCVPFFCCIKSVYIFTKVQGIDYKSLV